MKLPNYRLIEPIKINTWFQPVSARPLAGLRVGLSLLLFFHLVWISDDILSLHGSRGIIPWELTDLLRHPWVPGLPTLARAFLPFGISVDTAVILLLSCYAGSLLSLALGFCGRGSAFLAWGLHLSLITSGFASFYGVDQLVNTFLFYLLLFPSARAWTVKTHPASLDRDETIPIGCLRVMQIHLCVIYLASGLEKAMGNQWWSGEAIWQAVTQPAFSTSDLTWLARYPILPMLAGWGTLVVEIGYPFLVFPRRTRKLGCLMAIALHVGIALFMGLVFFSSVMILLTTCIFLIPEEHVAVPKRSLRFLPALVGIFSLLTFGPEALGETRSFDDLVPIVRRLMVRDNIPGVAVGLVEDGQLVFARGFGYRDFGDHLPVNSDTLFALGSCSKAFTATAVELLSEEGRIELDTPVRNYLPDFSLADPVATATLTTRDLLNHLSGLPRHDLFWYQAPFSRDGLYNLLRFLEPGGPPRTQWRYNSLMYVVAGRIIEKVTGKSWESFVQSRVLLPLKMHRTFLSPEAMEIDSNHATPYLMDEGRLQKIPMLKPLNMIAPAGDVHTNLRDLARWLTFHMTRSNGLLGEKVSQELTFPQAKMPASDQPEIQNRYYSLGWIYERYRNHPTVGHSGAIDGYTVHLGFLPETGQGLIVLMNRSHATEALTAVVFSAYDRLFGLDRLDWEKRLQEKPQPLLNIPDVPLDFPIKTVVGRYQHPAYGALEIRAKGDKIEMQFRNLRLTLIYQGSRGFISEKPITDLVPQISVKFSKQKRGERMQLFVPLNFDEGDPVEVFRRDLRK